MRISLLLQREPLPSILESTLSTFWSNYYSCSHAVTWRDKAASRQNSHTDSQKWLINPYLNTISVSKVTAAALDPIRREFSRSVQWWKRPFQRLYVQLASTTLTAPLLAQAQLEVSPPIPDATHKLVVPGNHKIRLLEHKRRLSYGILKSGFANDFMQRELTVRQQAVECNISVPRLVETADDGSWFSEAYVSGTPVNRLANQTQAVNAVHVVLSGLEQLRVDTKEETGASTYIQELTQRIRRLVQRIALIDDDQSNQLVHLVDALVEQGRSQPDTPLVTALCHGDLQPGNILLNDDGTWLIDWEYAGRRQVAYDIMVYALSSRFPLDLAQRADAFVATGNLSAGLDHQNVIAKTASGRKQQVSIFFLEELAFHLEENSQPLFNQLGSGLSLLSAEIGRWLRSGSALS